MYQAVIVDAPAKINLSLDITGRRPDGYHLLDSIMQTVALYDTVTISRMSGEGVYVSCDRPRVPCDETNHAHIAARRFFERFGRPDTAISIDLQKRVPVQAGMGGGSADAAAVLVGLNALLEVNAGLEVLCELGVTVGADVPFCILGGTRRTRGIGEQMIELPHLPDCHILIAKPEAGISTPESFRRYDALDAWSHPDTAALLSLLDRADIAGFAGKMENMLEAVADLPEIEALRQRMLKGGALGARMSGSGSAVFGIFESRGLAKHCMRKLYSEAQAVFLTRPSRRGAVVLETRGG